MSDTKSRNGADSYDAERYFLGEMTATEQEEFEQRMFESRELGDEVVDLFALAANARAVMEEERPTESAERSTTPAPTPWLEKLANWLRPQVLWPAATAALFAIVAYQTLVTAPRLREELANVMQPRVVAATVLRPMVRGEGNEVSLREEQPIVRLSFDVNWGATPQSATCRIEDANGTEVVRLPVSPDQFAGTMEIAVPADRLQPGAYALVLKSEPSGHEVRFEFNVTR